MLSAGESRGEGLAEKEMRSMTKTCKECMFMEVCEELEYPMDCENRDECEHYEYCMDGYYQAMEYDGE